MTSKELNKLIKKLTEEKEDLISKEEKASVFLCSVGENEDKVRPDYDFVETEERIIAIDKEIREMKHRLNIFNSHTPIGILKGDNAYTMIDEALVEIPQLSQRKIKLKAMANRLTRERVTEKYSSSPIVDYEIVNYDIAKVKAEYERVSERLDELQKLIDKANSTIEVD